MTEVKSVKVKKSELAGTPAADTDKNPKPIHKNNRRSSSSTTDGFKKLKSSPHFPEIEIRIKAGVAPEEVARWLQEDVLQYTDIQRDSLKRQLYRYKAALPAHELLKATEEPLWIKTAIDKMRRGINELEELEKMYLLQQRRINIDAQTEDKINKLFKGTNKEIELATSLLEKMIKLKIELGILDSQPSRIQFDGIMGTVPVELGQEGATESEADSMRLRLGLLSAKLVKSLSDFNPEKAAEKEDITH
jgi:hypothetical protein